MTPTTDLGLCAIPVAADDGPRCRLLQGGTPRGPVLDGAILEEQFALRGERLVLLTHDCPFEEALEVVLLDAQWRVVDRLSLGWMYSPGLVEDVEAVGNAVEFGFVGKNHWRVTVLAAPRRLPLTLFGYAKRPWRR